MIDNQKTDFLKNEYWANSISAAFSRANVYNKNLRDNYDTEKSKSLYKKDLKNYMDQLVEKKYSLFEIGYEEHINHIVQLQEKSYNKDLLNKDKDCKFSFGVAQKLLNLYLKYLWVSGIIEIQPPHFPIDRLILEKGLNEYKISWTKNLEKKTYIEIIEKAKSKLKDKQSLAEWELEVYNSIV